MFLSQTVEFSAWVSRRRSRSIRAVFLMALGVMSACCISSASAQGNFLKSWERRVNKTVSEQPAWPVPVATPPSGLVQLARFDAIRQTTSTHTETWIYGNSKGFDLIPWYKTEVDVTLPSYIEHNSKVRDGAGDWLMLAKYRFIAAGRKHGDYSLSVDSMEQRRPEAIRMAARTAHLRRHSMEARASVGSMLNPVCNHFADRSHVQVGQTDCLEYRGSIQSIAAVLAGS